MTWREKIGRLLGAAPKAKPRPAAAKKKGPPAIADSPRAKAIAEALHVHRTVGTQMRAQIAQSISELHRVGPKTLRDPAALERLMGLLQAQRTINWLMRHDLRRYLVLSGMRQLKGEDGAPPPASPTKSRVVRR